MRLLLDMNFSPKWIAPLREAGIEAIHWATIGAAPASDQSIIEWARENDFIVLTHDLDFGTLLALSGWSRPSVVQVRAQDIAPAALADLLIRALNEHREALESGALLTVSAVRQRVRILPL